MEPLRYSDHADAHLLASDEQDEDNTSQSKPKNRLGALRSCVQAYAKTISRHGSPVFLICAIILLLIVAHLVYSLSSVSLAWESDVSKTIKDWPVTSGKAYYPTWFTQNIMPKPLHSHNDEWRKVPFYSALEVGCISVEADVWLYHDELYVGHEISALTPNRTFQSLYVNPILDVLKKQNPDTMFSNNTRNGVFDVDSHQTLYLWIDLKTGGDVTWPILYKQLQPFRDKNYLTQFNGKKIVRGPVTVIATGNAPFDLMMSNTTYRDYFIDAPLEKIGQPNEPKSATGEPLFTNLTSIVASTQFSKYVGRVLGSVTQKHHDKINAQLAAAKERGLLTRYWDTPFFPVSRRNMVWRALTDAGVDLLNVDELRSAAFGKW